MGLWETTIRKQVSASAAVTEMMKKQGKSIDPPVTQRWHVCMTESRWKDAEAVVNTAPKGCVFTHKSVNDQGMSASMRCEIPGGQLIVIESQISWEKHEKSHSTVHLAITYPGVAGDYVVDTEYSSHFLNTDCDSVAPGASVPIK
jgi:hypothetical protein